MTHPSHRLILSILVGANSLAHVTTSLYIPSIPDLARDLGVPVALVQLTLTTYIFAFAISMLVLGPLSDRFGRRRVLLAGIGLSTAASLVCWVAPNVETLLVGRALQAVGACAGMALARAVVRDLFDRDGTARALALLAMAVTLMPVLAPLAGGYIHVWFGWRANFFLLAVLSALLLAVIARYLPETNLNLQNQHSMMHGFAAGLMSLLRAPRFIGFVLVGAGGACSFYGFAVAGSVLLIDHFSVAPENYGWYTLLGPAGFFAGSFFSRRFVLRAGIYRLIWLGAGGLVAATIAMAALADFAQPWIVLLPLTLMGIGTGLAMPNANAGGVSLRPQLAGTAAGLAGFGQMIAAGLATLVMAAVDVQTAWPLVALFLACAAMTVIGAAMASRETT